MVNDKWRKKRSLNKKNKKIEKGKKIEKYWRNSSSSVKYNDVVKNEIHFRRNIYYKEKKLEIVKLLCLDA